MNPADVISLARNKRRVLHVLPGLGIGGAVRAVCDLIAGLDRHGRYEQQLCVLGSSREMATSYRLPPAMIYLDYSGDWRNLYESRRVSLELSRVIEEFSPDVLHTHLWTADVIGADAAARTSTPHVAHLHDTRPWVASPKVRHRIRRFMTRRRFARSHAMFIACSDAVNSYFCRSLGILPERITTVRYGTDLSRFNPHETQRAFSSNRELVVGTAGRFDWEKGHENLFQALKILVERNRSVRLRIAGDGKLRPRYEEVIRGLRLEDRIEFVGVVRDMPAFYRSLDIFVLPSIAAEGLPLTILEALALATPTVATDVAGVSEVIHNGVGGMLVSAGDVEMLADAMDRLAADAQLREQIGNAGRDRILAQHSLGRMCDGVSEVYGRLLNEANQ